MIDWTASMQQTFEFYTVDPDTWGNVKKLTEITSASITWSSDDETLGSATIESTELLGECYIRIYLICIQNGVKYEYPLGTFIVQTPEETNNGRVKTVTMDAYTPLLELKDNRPPYGFTVFRNSNVLSTVSDLVSDHARAPVVRVNGSKEVIDDLVSDFDSDTWLSFLSSLLADAEYQFGLDEMGRILFQVKPVLDSLKPVWTYDDSNSSILYPQVKLSRDLYGIPNVVEVLFTTDTYYRFARVENNDENSPVSIPSRGREVVHRVTNPDGLNNPSQEMVDDYAANLLRDLSSLEYTISYTHGYCPVRVGDAVWINYERAGLTNIRALVTGQQIECRPGCPVTETAVFTTKLWR